jgi:hypothetical protein
MATIIDRERGIEPAGVRSGVIWAPVIAGAVVAIATTMILLMVGSGIGFAAASPWPGAAPTATSFAIGAGIWLIVTQWFSSFLGGFITGRLRTRWTGIHTHEVTFRDTAHGLLAWAVSTVIVAAVAFGGTISATGAVMSAASTSVSYAADTMLRSDKPISGASLAAAQTEAVRLLGREGGLQQDDKTYLTHVVASQTGVSDAEAQQRINMAVASIRADAGKARKVSSAVGFFTALSMLLGAFIAMISAAYGGWLRDERADMAPMT